MKPHRAFPPGRGNLKVPTSSRRAAHAGLALYAPCRPRGRLARWVAWRVVDLAGPRALPSNPTEWTPPVDVETWQALSSQWVEAVGPFDELAVHERIQVSRRGFAALLLSEGRPVGFVKVRDGDDAPLRNEHQALTLMHAASPVLFEVPRPLGLATAGGWSFLLTSALRPELHRMPIDPPIDDVAAEIQTGLASLPHPAETPEHWTPMHGDFTPWNLRQRRDGSLFLIDWEDAEWAPPGADVLYYLAVEGVLRESAPTAIARSSAEAVAFWRTRLSNRLIRTSEDRDSELLDDLLAHLDRAVH